MRTDRDQFRRSLDVSAGDLDGIFDRRWLRSPFVEPEDVVLNVKGDAFEGHEIREHATRSAFSDRQSGNESRPHSESMPLTGSARLQREL